MKYFIYTIVSIFIFASCTANKAKINCSINTDADSVACDYITDAAAVEKKKQEMLALPDNTHNFWFSSDMEFQSRDPHAYWLMNRMMQMEQMVETADDDWAWMLAVNESIKDYNGRLGRKIGSDDAAILAIRELTDIYTIGTQGEMNASSDIFLTLEHYKVVHAYYSHISFIDDDSFQELYYQEFVEWFNLNSALNAIMRSYTYAAVYYSALPMDLNIISGTWLEARLDELDIELGYRVVPFESDAEPVSNEEFDVLLSYFKVKNQDDVVEKIISDWKEKDYDYIRERIDGRFNFDRIGEVLHRYETALANWRGVREQITQMLPVEKQKSYREITKQMHTRLYHDLQDLKEIQY